LDGIHCKKERAKKKQQILTISHANCKRTKTQSLDFCGSFELLSDMMKEAGHLMKSSFK
jgi:hypothetical protein